MDSASLTLLIFLMTLITILILFTPPDLLLNSLTFSNIISMLTVGLVLTYLTLKVPNFAHGDLASIGFYVSYALYRAYGLNPYFSIPVSFLVSGAVALMIYKAVYRVLQRRRADIVNLMVASIAVDIIIRTILYIYSDAMREYTRTFYRGFIFHDVTFRVGCYSVSFVAIASTIASVSMVLALYYLLMKTKTGIAMRAAIENPDLAETLGIDIDKMYSLSWFIAGGIAGAAGVFIPFRMASYPDTGWNLLLRMFSAAVLGGLDNIFGAIVGGYIVGLVEVLGIYYLSKPPIYLSSAYRPAIPYVILVSVLLFAPKGVLNLVLGRRCGKND